MANIKQKIPLKVPAKATMWYVGSGIISRGIGALSTPIFTRLLTPSQYGLYPLYNSWINILSILITIELTGVTIYRGFQKYSDEIERFTSAALGLLGILFTLFCALYFAFYNIIERFVNLNLMVTFFMFAQIFFGSVTSLYIARAKFKYKYKVVAFINLISALVIPLTSVALILLFDIGAESRIFSSSITTIIIAIPIIIHIILGSDKLFDKEIWIYLIRHSIPMLPHYIATAMIIKATEISIGQTHGTQALAKYSIAISIGMILTVVTNGITSALGPWLTRKLREGSIDKTRDFLLNLTMALSLIALCVLSFAPELLVFFATKDYGEALPAIYPLEIAVILAFLSGSVNSLVAGFDQARLSSLPSVISALISASLSFFVLPKTDYRFASVFVFICYATLLILLALYFKHISGEFPIHTKGTAIIITVSMMYAYVLFTFRSAFLSRIFLSLPLIPLSLISAKKIWHSVKE